MKFKLGDLCLTCNMINPFENNLEAEVTGVGITKDGYRGVKECNAFADYIYEVFIPALKNPLAKDSVKYGLFDIPEYRLTKLPPGDEPAEFDVEIWVPKDVKIPATLAGPENA